MNMRQTILGLLALFLFFLSVSGCEKLMGGDEEAATETKTASDAEAEEGGKLDEQSEEKEAEKSVVVRVQTLQKEEVRKETLVSGSVQTDFDLTILAETSGTIVTDRLELGKSFKRGALLVAVDSEPYRIALDAANANYARASAALEQNRLAYERAKALKQSNDISISDYDNIRLGYEQAKAGELSAKAEVDRAKRALRLSSVRAPFAGEIARKLVKKGQMISMGSPVAQLVSREEMKVQVGVGEDEIGLIETGSKAKVFIPTLQKDPMMATIQAIGPKAIEPTMTYPIELSFDEDNPNVRIGMVAQVKIPLGAPFQAIVVDLETLTDRFERKYLYVVNGETVEEREVVLGLKTGNRAVIESGVEAGETIVVVGQSNLKDGASIQVVE